MTIDRLNEVKLRALEMSMDILRDEESGVKLLANNEQKDIFSLADKIFNYITDNA